MRQEPRIIILLDLSDGQPPISCRSVQEAEFLADVWRVSDHLRSVRVTNRTAPSVRPNWVFWSYSSFACLIAVLIADWHAAMALEGARSFGRRRTMRNASIARTTTILS